MKLGFQNMVQKFTLVGLTIEQIDAMLIENPRTC